MTSKLHVDTLSGKTTNGSISVISEGNTNTTTLQQGLAKHWILMNGTSTIAVTDSFNNTSITDNGTASRRGRHSITVMEVVA